MSAKKPVSIRLSEANLQWLARDGLPFIEQLRLDLALLRCIYQLRDLRDDWSLVGGVEAAEKMVFSMLGKKLDDCGSAP